MSIGAVEGRLRRAPALDPTVRLASRAKARPAWVVVLGAVVASRLLVLAAGVAGALAVSRRDGWTGYDPTGLTSHLGSLGNALAAPFVRWDAIHYLSIARHGYASASSSVFYPLYPALIRGIGLVTGSDAVAGVLISLTAFGVALMLLHRLTELELGRGAADACALLLCFAPMSLFFSAVYTESLFLALSIGAVYAARLDRWPLAAALGALAALTRVPGILLVVPLALLYVRGRDGRRWREWAWLGLIPAAPLAFSLYLASRGYGLLAPASRQGGAAHGHEFTGPVDSLIGAMKAAASGFGALVHGIDTVYSPTVLGPLSVSAESVLLLAVLALAVWALITCARRLPAAYAAYAGLSLLVCVSSPVQGQPLASLDRYCLTIFPLWMAAAAWLSQRRRVGVAVVIGALLLGFYAFQFSTWAFVA